MADRTEGQGGGRGAGRPRIPVEDQRVAKIDVRVTNAEARTLTELAHAAGKRLREFIRDAALGVRIISPVDPVTTSHAARLVQIGQTLARIERLALAGRIVGLPPEDIADLRRLAEHAAMAVLGVVEESDGDARPCSP
ncbi:hypothetical protein FHR71_005597 [Methylobacterium sp. RAS18]|nr:hypothetical protein [Methylobacterium sp. RAS18]